MDRPSLAGAELPMPSRSPTGRVVTALVVGIVIWLCLAFVAMAITGAAR